MFKTFLSFIFLFTLIASSTNSQAQIIDKFGVRTGVGISNQYWEYPNAIFVDPTGWMEPKGGFAIYVNAEKNLIKFVSIRAEIGFLQKGYTDSITITNIYGDRTGLANIKLRLNNLAINISGKISPFDMDIKPYIVAGIRSEILLGYKYETYNKITESTTISDNNTMDNFKNILVSGILGIGVEYKDMAYFEFEYNPAFSKNYKTDDLVVNDRYFAFTLGFNISALLK